MLREWVPVMAGPAVLVVVTCILFRRVLWPVAGQGMFGFDLGYAFEPWWRFWATCVRSGYFPLWNPHSLLGTPFLANPQVGLAYPPNWLFILVPLRFALGWGAAFHIALAAIGMYVWTGCLRISRWGRTIAGFTYAFSSFFILRLYAGHYSLVAVASWFPWLLYVGFRVCHFTSLKSSVVASIVLSLAFLAGYPPLFAIIAGFTGLCCLTWVLRHPTTRRWRSLAGLLLTGFLALLLVAVQLVPLLELMLYSSRVARPTYQFATSFALMRRSFVTIVAPDLLNVVAFWEFNLFVGAISILLAAVALARLPRRAWSWFGLAVVALLIGLGDKGGLYTILYRMTPGLELIRAPARFSILYLLSISILAGMGMDCLLRSTHSSVLVIMLGLGLGLVVIGGIAWADGDFADYSTRQLVIFDSIRWCSFAGLLCLVDWMLRRSTRRALGVAVIVLVASDMLSQGDRFIRAGSLDVEPRWQVIDAAFPSRRDTYRLLTIGELDHNQSMSLGFYGVGGYDPLSVAWARDMIDMSLNLADPVLDMLSVKYVVHDARLPVLEADTGPVAWSDDLFVYERSTVMPRVFTVGQYELVQDPLVRLRDPMFDPRALILLSVPPDCVVQHQPSTDLDTLVVRAYQPDYVCLEVNLAAERLVVLNDLYYPGWEVTVDGNPAEMIRANHALRAVCVPIGAHRVEFRYRPWWIMAGLAMSITAWGAVTLYLSYGLSCKINLREIINLRRRR